MNLNNTPFLVLDTQTTGLHERAEICQIAIVDRDGRVPLDQLVKPTADVEIDPENVRCIQSRLKSPRPANSVERFYANYAHAKDLKRIGATQRALETPIR